MAAQAQKGRLLTKGSVQRASLPRRLIMQAQAMPARGRELIEGVVFCHPCKTEGVQTTEGGPQNCKRELQNLQCAAVIRRGKCVRKKGRW